MNEATILYFEPQRIADWDEGIFYNFKNRKQKFTPKIHFIRLVFVLHRASKERPLEANEKRIIREYAEDNRCGLGDEIRGLFPDLF